MPGALRHRTAPPASRRQPVPATRLKPGLPLRGHSPMTNPFQTVSEKGKKHTMLSQANRASIG